MDEGVQWLEKGDAFRAVESLNRAIEINPEMAEAYRCRGQAYTVLSMDDMAIADYNKATYYRPGYAEALNNRGLIYHEKGLLARALSDYTSAIQADPKMGDAYYNRANAYLDLSQPAKAIEDCSHAIRLNPRDVLAYYNRGYAYSLGSKAGELNKAVLDLNRALSLNPDFVKAAYLKAETLRRLDSRQDAIEAYRYFLKRTTPRYKNFEDLAKRHLATLERAQDRRVRVSVPTQIVQPPRTAPQPSGPAPAPVAQTPRATGRPSHLRPAPQVQRDPNRPTVRLHKVKPGETLERICMRFGIMGPKEVARVAHDNSLKDPNGIKPGMLLRIVKWPE